jgi:hypothetical protein
MAAFERHRVPGHPFEGQRHRRPGERRCLDRLEMLDRGMLENEGGYWMGSENMKWRGPGE